MIDLRIKVIPRAKKTEMAGVLEDGSLKIKVAAVPEDGRANKELCDFLARHYGVARIQVELIAGATSTRKLIRVRQ